VSEDEAFIRTIVDSPGDDLPRLVYADWLDERGDERGDYLRAEVEWAKGLREVGWASPTVEEQERWAVPTLRQMAEGLDPIWVARVSRPPFGICCDHLAQSKSERWVEADEFEWASGELKQPLPP
jgi:uncharacterized protein (TIGR02996 family)